MTPALNCFKCMKELVNVWEDADNQPHDATTFITEGHYGSTVFDPMDRTRLEINICDDCLRRGMARVYHVTPVLPYPRESTYRDWDPNKEYA